MKIEHVAISSLVLDPNNARKHDEKNLEAIKGSLTKFGMQKPIVVDKKGVVLAGNGTLAAAKALGWEKIAVVRTDLEGFNAAAYALADNRTSELASWDEDVLGKSLHELREIDFELGDIGFDTSYLDKFNVPDFDPGTLDDQGKLDEKKKALCPECGHEFTP